MFASYFFYGCWDWRFVFLLAFSTLLDYYAGIKIHDSKSEALRKTWLVTAIGINLGFLGVFKYYNFFIDSFSNLLSLFGFDTNYPLLTVILPVGISFYTFHGLSYVFDIYNRRIEPTRNFVNYSLFVSFFPLLVAGPIERATHLLPQVERPRKFIAAHMSDGLRQILWGFFKKIVIADNCAEYANLIFNNSNSYEGSVLVLGAFFFAIQIYGDFSGYSDIALGTARLFGFELLKNFAYPYFSRNVAEFWRRWHISLSSWFRDYIYFPLGGSRGSNWLRIRNTFIIFLISGFWHGANWTFIAWGALNALFILPSVVMSTNRQHLDIVAKGKIAPSIREFIAIVGTFTLTTFAWIFFRAESLTHAFSYIESIFSSQIITNPFQYPELKRAVLCFIPIVPFFIIEWFGRENNYAIERIGLSWPRTFRWTFYSFVIFFIGMYMQTMETDFIYFQF
ncbi:MBOAT family O-acyltransferase [Dyadobacter sp.]|uniref:MBOAT family O-acyltransferase n=1 Tax=Dyadobacter sp. TaxID=1914288 RepID=UPI003F724365